MTHPLSIADLPVYIWLRSHVYRSYPHIALITMQTRTQSLIPCSTRSLSLYGCISARVSPTYNLTVLYNYSQRSAYVKFPCKRFSLFDYCHITPVTLIPTTRYMCLAVKRTYRSRQSSTLRGFT